MKQLNGNYLWEEILALLELIFSETYRFPEIKEAFSICSALRGDILFIASQYAHIEEGIITAENLLPFFRIESRLRKMLDRLHKCYDEKWFIAEQYYLINQKIISIEGQIKFRINHFSTPNIPKDLHRINLKKA
jgi:hypothetical protein